MDRHVLDEPLADDPDPSAVAQGFAILAPGPHESFGMTCSTNRRMATSISARGSIEP